MEKRGKKRDEKRGGGKKGEKRRGKKEVMEKRGEEGREKEGRRVERKGGRKKERESEVERGRRGKRLNRHSHTDVASKGDVRTAVRFAHDSYHCYPRSSPHWLGLQLWQECLLVGWWHSCYDVYQPWLS